MLSLCCLLLLFIVRASEVWSYENSYCTVPRLIVWSILIILTHSKGSSFQSTCSPPHSAVHILGWNWLNVRDEPACLRIGKKKVKLIVTSCNCRTRAHAQRILHVKLLIVNIRHQRCFSVIASCWFQFFNFPWERNRSPIADASRLACLPVRVDFD